MSDHPIESLMTTAMENILEMVDVNTVVGEPVETPDGSVIIPISKVTAGFAAGGGEYDGSSQEGGSKSQQQASYPFGGGSGAGVSVKPVGFLVSRGAQVRLVPVSGNAILDHLIDSAPQMFAQLKDLIRKNNTGGSNITINTPEQ